jgi:Mce-associated membrane protein
VEVAVPPAPDQDPGLTSNPHDGTQSATFRLVLFCVLVVALLASAGVLVFLVADRRGEADDVQADREQVMAQAEQFMLRTGTYGPDLLDDKGGMPKYRDLVTEVITPKFATSFDKEAATAEQLVAQAGVARKADVFSTGVSVIDSDSATALVAGSFTQSFPKSKDSDQRVEQEPVPFRMEVTLVKSDGKWLVDDFEPVTEAEQ